MKARRFICKVGHHNFHTKSLFWLFPWITLRNRVRFTVSLKECKYSFQDADQYDYNKLVGLSTAYHHRRESFRIGWRYVPHFNRFDIALYVYENKERYIVPILMNENGIRPAEIFNVDLIIKANVFYVLLHRYGESVEAHYMLKRGRYTWWPFRYYLTPWFGGNKVAPHKMILELTMNKKRR